MEKLHKKTIFLYIIIFLLLVGLLGAGLFIFRRIQTHIQNVRAVKEKIASVETYEPLYLEEVEKIAAIEQSLAVLEKEIVTDVTLPRVLSQIESLAAESSIVAEITSVQIVTPKAKPRHMSIDIKAEGALDALVAFMNMLESTKSQTSIEKFALTQTGQSSNANTWELTVTLFVLSYK